MVATTAGWMGLVEVVEVEFDPQALPYAELLAHAVQRDCAIRVFSRSAEHQILAAKAVGERAERSDAAVRAVQDQKYYLGRTPLRHVPMTAAQATRINADLDRARSWLSPRQLTVLDAATRRPRLEWPDALHEGLTATWDTAWELAHSE